MVLISTGDLERWGTKTTARDKLGELMSRLIHAGIPLQNIGTIRFLADESTQLSGWDGLLECTSEVPWIPSGSSVWELSTESNARNKIKRDYKNRVDKEIPKGWNRKNTTYVAVTLNKLQDLTDFENEFNDDTPWKMVKIYDSQSVADWIQNFPSVETWLQEQGVGPPPSIRTLESMWTDWSIGTNPVISTGLVMSGRDEVGKQFLNALAGGGLISVRADSPDEATAFVYSVLKQSDSEPRDHDLARSVVVRNTNDADKLRGSPPLIVILSPPATERAQMLAQSGHIVINALGNSSHAQKTDFHLSRPLRSQFTDALVEMGMSKEDAKVEAQACGSSSAVWRVWNNLQHGDVSTDIPIWSKTENVALVIPAILLGGWSDRFEGDREVIEKITGLRFEDYRDNLRPYLSKDNPLLVKIDDAWIVTAPATAFALATRDITTGDLEKLSEIVTDVFQENDPSIDLDPNERPYASIHTEGMRHSSWLRDGLAETLLRVVILGQRLEREGIIPGNRTCQEFVDTLIRNLNGLSEDWRLIASLRDQLPVLAEAAPVPFLEALDSLLRGDPKTIQPLFAEGNTMSGHSFHPNLLWALETLAWDPQYLGRVGIILAQSANIDPGGRISNRPINSLTEILLAWHPGTSADLDQRLQVIDLILEKFPEIGWSLLNSLMPRSSQISHPTHEPKWRDFDRSHKQPLTRKDVWMAYEQYVDRAIQHAGDNHLRWRELLDIYPNVSESHQKKIEKGLEKLSEGEPGNDESNSMWKTLREFVNRHKGFPDATWALPSDRLQRLDEIAALFSPEDLMAQNSWLFNEHFPDIPYPKKDIEGTKVEIKKLRVKAVEQIWKEGEMTTLTALIDNVLMPGMISEPLLELVKEESEILSVFEKTITGSDNERIFAKCLSKDTYSRFGDSWTDLLVAKASELEWSNEQIVSAFIYYPDTVKTFDLIAAFGNEVERQYWENKPALFGTNDDESLKTIIKKLSSVGRALDAIMVSQRGISSLKTNQVFELLDQALLELNEGKEPSVGGGIEYEIDQLFDWLRSRSDVDRSELAKREYAYLPLLTRYYGKKRLALHDLLSTDPGFFVEVICDVYKPASGGSEDEKLSEQQRHRAEFGWKLLNSWHWPPGVDNENKLDGQKMRDWVEKARELASKADRVDIADQQIGTILYYSPDDPADSAWPHVEVRKLLEDIQSDHLERGIEVEQFNSRGTVSKAVFEGGDQEREIAERWRDWAKTLGTRWPRTRAMLERIANSWERDAKREDERAEKDRYRFS